jgi:hypothetical protein
MMGRFALAMLLAAAALSGCGDDVAPTAVEDPSKLSEEMEAEAQAIEGRAEEAVKAAEQQADAELRRLRAEAEAASTSSETTETEE